MRAKKIQTYPKNPDIGDLCPMSLHAVSHSGTTTWHDEHMCCVKLRVTTTQTSNMTMVVPLCDTAHTTNPPLLWHGTERLAMVCDVSHCGTPTYCHTVGQPLIPVIIHVVPHCRTTTWPYEPIYCSYAVSSESSIGNMSSCSVNLWAVSLLKG